MYSVKCSFLNVQCVYFALVFWSGMDWKRQYSFILISIHTMRTEIMVIQLNKIPISSKCFKFVLCICPVFGAQYQVSSDCQNVQCSFIEFFICLFCFMSFSTARNLFFDSFKSWILSVSKKYNCEMFESFVDVRIIKK